MFVCIAELNLVWDTFPKLVRGERFCWYVDFRCHFYFLICFWLCHLVARSPLSSFPASPLPRQLSLTFIFNAVYFIQAMRLSCNRVPFFWPFVCPRQTLSVPPCSVFHPGVSQPACCLSIHHRKQPEHGQSPWPPISCCASRRQRGWGREGCETAYLLNNRAVKGNWSVNCSGDIPMERKAAIGKQLETFGTARGAKHHYCLLWSPYCLYLLYVLTNIKHNKEKIKKIWLSKINTANVEPFWVSSV